MTTNSKMPNRLIHEKSPYLLQHAHNPVDWYPWGDEAFLRAKAENKPIFLSIGYSTCHWCHVMEKESFEDESIGELLNDSFVCIKLDREERPDIDHIYMDICQALTGSGGWPLTIIMDSDAKPFFAGTYFPKESLRQIVNNVNKMWKNNKGEIDKISKEIIRFINNESKPSKINDKIIDDAFNQLKHSFDNQFGGFGREPKFPTPHMLLFLLNYGTAEGINMVDKTLDSMYRGGIYDHIGHGFCRYSTDRIWLVPHFEKMLYDNALLAYAYTKAYSITKKPLYKEVAVNTLNYMLSVKSKEGGIYSALDADSEGIEGKFYVWSFDEIKSVLGGDYEKYCKIYNISKKGNFEGKNIPNLINSDITDEDKPFIENCRQRLFAEREGRVHPFLDDKILTSWNGLAIAAFSLGSIVFKNSHYSEVAADIVSFIDSNLCESNGKLLSRYRDGQAKYIAHGEDYAYYIWGLLELHQATQNMQYLSRAIELNEKFLKDFWDNHSGGFFFSNKQEKLISKPKPLYDGATPSLNSVAAMNLLKLFVLTGEIQYRDFADKIFENFASELKSSPISYSNMMSALLYKKSKLTKVVIVANNLTSAKDMIDIASEKAQVITKIEKFETPYMSDYSMIDNSATAYVCDSAGCHPPVTNTEDLVKLI